MSVHLFELRQHRLQLRLVILLPHGLAIRPLAAAIAAAAAARVDEGGRREKIGPPTLRPHGLATACISINVATAAAAAASASVITSGEAFVAASTIYTTTTTATFGLTFRTPTRPALVSASNSTATP